MDTKQIKTARSILKGIHFLLEEADRAGLKSIARLLTGCAHKIEAILKPD
jgi:hypothetical protein